MAVRPPAPVVGLHASFPQREKEAVAARSVAAALVLTGLKLAAGLWSGSLAVLAEAAHSALDLGASLLTYLAVRWAGRPSDREHPYGHGRIENLAALVQASLLALTAGAIGYRSLLRLALGSPPLHLAPWAMAVMALSMAVDFWRSRRLREAGLRYRSQVLLADALAFRADMWGSAVVLAGVAVAYAGRGTPAAARWQAADAVAALVVAAMVALSSLRLARQALDLLIDRSPVEVADRMERAVRAVPGVIDAGPLRLRQAGGRFFADVVVRVPRSLSLARAHDISEAVEDALRRVEPLTDAVVHVEPAAAEDESPAEAVRAVADALGLRSHHERVFRVADGVAISLHLELPAHVSLDAAHRAADRLERALRRAIPGVRAVDIHLEPQTPAQPPQREEAAAEAQLARQIRRLAEEVSGQPCGEVRLYREGVGKGARWHVAVTCRFPPDAELGEVHERTERVELEIRRLVPRAGEVVVHAEPGGGERPATAPAPPAEPT